MIMKKCRFTLLSAAILGLPSLASADPSDIFAKPGSLTNSSNILFVLDTSGSMGWSVGNTNRISIMKSAFADVMKDADANSNIGLLQFGAVGSRVIFPVSPIESSARSILSPYESTDNIFTSTSDSETVREFLPRLVHSWSASGGTPITSSLLEAAYYFQGADTYLGRNAQSNTRASHPSSYVGNPSTGAGKYISPIKSACQKNYLVLMSDGAPNGADDTAQSKIRSEFLGGASCRSSVGVGGGQCSRDLTKALFEKDLNSSIAEKQNVETFSIGFRVQNDTRSFLQSLVTANDGNGYYSADNASGLKAAFQSILDLASQDGLSFGSPSFSADQGNLLSHGNQVYVPVFGRTKDAEWKGNLRKFKVKEDGTLVGKGDQPATDQYGQFTESAHDFWSSNPAGASAAKGGAANLLPSPNQRNLYTEDALGIALGELKHTNNKVTAGLLMSLIDPPSCSSCNNEDEDGENEFTKSGAIKTHKKYGYQIIGLSNSGQWQGGSYFRSSSKGKWEWLTDAEIAAAIAEIIANYKASTPASRIGNSPLSDALQSAADIQDGLCSGNANKLPYCISRDFRKKLINYARGIDKDGSTRYHMGDIMHSKPVTYRYSDSKSLVFVGTNEGYLHAFDSNTGVEAWSFMPALLLKNIYKFYEGEDEEHIYGVDAPLVIWKNDLNEDGKIEASKNESVYLIFGLGHGKEAYYALDITDASRPELAWRVTQHDNSFKDLGLTWSKPILSTMRLAKANSASSTPSSEKVPVVIFGGGYDRVKSIEDATTRPEDRSGKNIYIINAKTGDLIWSLDQIKDQAMYEKLKHSVVSDIRVLDVDGDETLDRLYFSDTGGSLWRVDMNVDVFDDDESKFDYTKAQLTHLADLGTDDQGNDKRKFFVAPDISMLTHNGRKVILLAIGSGYRMRPLNTDIHDRFYVIQDPYINDIPPKTYKAIRNSDLAHVDDLEGSFLEAGVSGWYLPLNFAGEKVLSPSLTFLNKVIFTTFSVADRDGVYSGEKECSLNERSSRAYAMNILTGKAVADLQRNGGKSRYAVMGIGGFLDTPQVIFKAPTNGSGGACTGNDCKQYVDIRVGNARLPLIDSTNTSDNSVAESVDLSKVMPKVYWRNEKGIK